MKVKLVHGGGGGGGGGMRKTSGATGGNPVMIDPHTSL